ncbi:hypothetical protein H7Y40_01415 [Pedobacter sp.]|nr:hypothetical protein [Candidatus Saccharibacteria bacterium]
MLASGTSTAERDTYTQEKSEVIPTAVVVHLVDAHAVVEERHHEGNRQNHAVPETQPPASNVTDRCGYIDDVVRACGTASEDDDQQDGEQSNLTVLTHNTPMNAAEPLQNGKPNQS